MVGGTVATTEVPVVTARWLSGYDRHGRDDGVPVVTVRWLSGYDRHGRDDGGAGRHGQVAARLRPAVRRRAVVVGQGVQDGAASRSARASKTELRAGQSAKVTVTLDAGRRTTSMLSAYTGAVTLVTDSPHQAEPVPVTMKVRPPRSWARVTGTVSGPGGPLAGASVRVEYGPGGPLAGMSVRVEYGRGGQTVVTGADGRYEAWLERGPVKITAR
ncbi:hypothetical protein [Nonomuraea insulae]|uniref:Carboxypeptidase regulatory-like domain-containing protein n=1 Tax=Nonomuraea insulae TaxID=1616787 RepID=A0ABW1CMP0_9ACTN